MCLSLSFLCPQPSKEGVSGLITRRQRWASAFPNKTTKTADKLETAQTMFWAIFPLFGFFWGGQNLFFLHFPYFWPEARNPSPQAGMAATLDCCFAWRGDLISPRRADEQESKDSKQRVTARTREKEREREKREREKEREKQKTRERERERERDSGRRKREKDIEREAARKRGRENEQEWETRNEDKKERKGREQVRKRKTKKR